MSKTPQKVFDHYCEVSSCAGVVDSYSSRHKFGTVFWFVMVVLGIAATCFQGFSMFRDYLNGGAGNFQTTVTRERMTNDTPFPPVTICNFNRAMKSKLQTDKIDPKILEYAYGAIPLNYDVSMGNLRHARFWEKNMTVYENLWREYGKGKEPNIGQMLRRYGHDCNLTILKSVAHGVDVSHDQICDYAEEKLTTHGRCWRYVTGRSQLHPGPSGGLQLTVNPALDEYPENTVINNFLESGLFISLNPVYGPDLIDPIIVEPGKHAYISMAMTIERYIPQRWPVFKMDCREDKEFKYVIANYTLANCKLDCLADVAQTYVGCVPLLETKLGRPCTPNETMNFIQPFFDGSLETWKDDQAKIDLFRDCDSQCINSCSDFVKIDATVTVAPMFTDQSRRLAESYIRAALPQNMSFGKTEDLIRIDIYFPVLQYTAIEITEATPLFTFIANLGGNLGLWTSMCAMSLVQVIYYFIYGAVRLCRRPNKKISDKAIYSQTPMMDIVRNFPERTDIHDDTHL